MTEPVITPEIRQAVLDAECETLGHRGVGQLLETIGVCPTTTGRNTRLEGSPDAMPYVECERCGRVWIVAYRNSGRNYNQAQRRFRERLLATDPDALPPE